jgi:uncharacterized membrane protein YeaQ/YmgE (transglycosylase-associated protein family)
VRLAARRCSLKAARYQLEQASSAFGATRPGTVLAPFIPEGNDMDSLRAVIWFLLIGGLAGFLAGKIMRGHGFGVFGDILVGIFGAVIGGFLFGLLNLASYGLLGSLVTATVGAIVLLWALRRLRSA